MKMTDEMKKQIQQLKTENENLLNTMMAMRREINALAADVTEMHKDSVSNLYLRKSVYELQDELRKSDLDIDIINSVYAPMRVDGR